MLIIYRFYGLSARENLLGYFAFATLLPSEGKMYA